MLKLVNITKTYKTGELTQDALKNISVNFRENEFVSILGQSGSGKTTMLNLIGGLDRYTSGDLIINDRSTKRYRDKDWDSYRNHSVGFIFQSYNLIPHQTVLSNVELALTLAGVSSAERKERAKQALIDVGLKDHMHKKPNQMSGGQMQRVAIARALVNNPDILLADEPTGALDSETSVQIMNLLQNIAKDKLVIMVTHNPELAKQYSTRIINLFDGEIIDDSNPYDPSLEVKTEAYKKPKKVFMSLFTALSLSLSNLATKKGRTFLTAFAGSIGIIGIALILSLSAGMQTYILQIQEDTLTSYPITIQSQTVDFSGMQGDEMQMLNEALKGSEEHELDKIYQRGFVGDRIKMENVQIQNNNLERFKQFLDSEDGDIVSDNTSAILYGYDLNLQIYKENEDNYTKVNPSPLFEEQDVNEMESMMTSSLGMSNSVFAEMIGNSELLETQYDVVAGTWPEKYNEVVVVTDKDNQISDMTLYVLGLKDQKDYEAIKAKVTDGEAVNKEDYDSVSFTYDEILQQKFKLVLNTDYFEKSEDIWVDRSIDENYMNQILEEALDLNVVGIIRPSENAKAEPINGTIGYNSELVDHIITNINDSEIVKDQKDRKDTDIFNNKEFSDEPISEQEFIANLEENQRAYFMSLSVEERTAFIDQYSTASKSTYDNNLNILGVVNKDKPSSINLYLKDFEARDKVIGAIDDYNQLQIDNKTEDYTITFTDIIGMMISSMISIIDMITYALIGFVSISLVVSSIMIGIITYISVLERVKEIGILRSVGASKKDIVRVFIAETMIIGLISGLIGIGATILLNVPINALIRSLSGVSKISSLPITGGAILVGISVFLTTIAGFIPARMASQKDPVEALRNE